MYRGLIVGYMLERDIYIQGGHVHEGVTCIRGSYVYSRGLCIFEGVMYIQGGYIYIFKGDTWIEQPIHRLDVALTDRIR